MGLEIELKFRCSIFRFCFGVMCLTGLVFLEIVVCSDREYQRGDEIAWYADGDKIVRQEHNPAAFYAFGITV